MDELKMKEIEKEKGKREMDQIKKKRIGKKMK